MFVKLASFIYIYFFALEGQEEGKGYFETFVTFRLIAYQLVLYVYIFFSYQKDRTRKRRKYFVIFRWNIIRY